MANITTEIADEIMGRYSDLGDPRRASLARAVELGVDERTFVTLCEALRLARPKTEGKLEMLTIVLPAHRYESLSRGRGWARRGKGAGAVWGERTEHGYRVGPGRWVVGGHDGFSRKGEDVWTVEHVQVGPETWTVAS